MLYVFLVVEFININTERKWSTTAYINSNLLGTYYLNNEEVLVKTSIVKT